MASPNDLLLHMGSFSEPDVWYNTTTMDIAAFLKAFKIFGPFAVLALSVAVLYLPEAVVKSLYLHEWKEKFGDFFGAALVLSLASLAPWGRKKLGALRDYRKKKAEQVAQQLAEQRNDEALDNLWFNLTDAEQQFFGELRRRGDAQEAAYAVAGHYRQGRKGDEAIDNLCKLGLLEIQTGITRRTHLGLTHYGRLLMDHVVARQIDAERQKRLSQPVPSN